MSHTCRRLFPSYETLKSTFSRYYHIRLFSTAQPKESKTNRDTLTGVLELYDSDGVPSGRPTRKDLYETSMAVPARSLTKTPDQHIQVDSETDTSRLVNGTHWYK